MQPDRRDTRADRLKDRLVHQILRRDDRGKPWVFNIGLAKTGTTSLTDALNILGYRAFHLPPITRSEPRPGGRIEMDWPWWVHRYDALTDMTVAVLWRELAARYPNARFIYTTRDIDGWLDSCRRHFTRDLADARRAQGQDHLIDLRIAFLGAATYQPESYRAAYQAHDSDVRAHFEGAANFLHYDLIGGAGWEPLCRFLGHPVPEAAFPAANKGRSDL